MVDKSEIGNSQGILHNQETPVKEGKKLEEEIFDNLKGLDISASSEHSDDHGVRRTNIKMNFNSVTSKKDDDQDSIHVGDSDNEGANSKYFSRHSQKEAVKHEQKPSGDEDEGEYMHTSPSQKGQSPERRVMKKN